MRRPLVRTAFGCALAAWLIAAGLVAVESVSADTAPRRIVNGWLPYWSTTESLNSVTSSADLWAEASPFWYQATGATTITRHTGAGDPAVVQALRGRGIKVIPTVTESLNCTAMAAMLGNATQRAAHVQTLVALVTTNGYDGIDLDYESMNFGCTTATDRTNLRARFVTLVRELGAALDGHGSLLSVTVGPRTRNDDPNWAVFDYAGIAPAADRVRIMTYDYHWRGGSPGAVAPVPWVNSVLAYAVTVITPSKIEAGVPLYGYDWPADPTQPDGYGTATSRTYAQAEALRVQYGAARQWSSTDGAPYFTYTANGVRHLVWYNDVDATKTKMYFIERYGLRGLAFWAVGAEDTRQWGSLRAYAIQKSTALTISVAPTTVGYGSAVTVSGTLTATTGGARLAGRPVQLHYRWAGSTTWRTVATGTTSSTGTVSLTYVPGGNGEYRLYSPASWTYLAATSPTATALVRWRVTAKFDDATVSPGTTAYLRGTVAPVRAGTTVQRQQYSGGVWRTVASAAVRSDGTYVFPVATSARGTYVFRVVAAAATLNTTGFSPQVSLIVG
ncbi:MAG TPA: glycosyl hydrolase family 18 protein [Pilimelia sp.]|nr:glycosyl hydrolase family 18 protein [Pilimelia sp.]